MSETKLTTDKELYRALYLLANELDRQGHETAHDTIKQAAARLRELEDRVAQYEAKEREDKQRINAATAYILNDYSSPFFDAARTTETNTHE